MSSESGYGKIPTSGLRLFYDTGDTDASFKGKPTTNLVPDASTMAGWSNYDNGNDGTFITEFGTTGYKMYNRGSWNGIVRGISLPSTGTYTVSAYFRYLGGASDNNGGQVYTNGGGIGDTSTGHSKVVGEWVRVSMTRTYTTTSINFYLISYGGTYGGSYSSWEVTMPQVEAGSIATPWVNGTRSTTAALLDISGVSTLEVMNNPFDTNGDLNLDGTNTYIQVNQDVLSSSSPYTLVTVLRPTNLSSMEYSFPQYNTYPYGFWHHMGSDGWILWRHSAGDGSLYPHSMSNNTWGMHTISWDGSRLRLYANGVLTTSTSTSAGYSNNGSGLARIGMLSQRSSGYDYNYNGRIPVNMVYNRALSQSEICDIYEHFRPRYSLPAIKDGSTESLAAPSAQYLADIGIKANGVYWINNGTTTKQTYCEFKNGEGWMLVMNIKSDYYGDSYLSWNDYNNWINSGSDLGNAQYPYVGDGQYRNRDIFRYCPTTKWMIKVHNNGTEFGDGSWGAWQINSTYSGQTFEQIMNIPGATGGGTQISSTYYAQEGMGTTTYARGLDYCSIARTLGHLRVNHLLDNNGVRILGNEQTLETANNDVTRGIGQIYDIAGTALTNQAYAQYNTHIGPYVNSSTPFTGNRRQFTDQLFPDNSNYNAARGEGLNVNPSLTYGGSPAMIAYYHYAIFIK